MTNRDRFCALIAFSEGAEYDLLVTGIDGKHETFDSFAAHPFEYRPAKLIREHPTPLYSTAAGRYQLILPTWHLYRTRLGLNDFSPASQDAVAIELIREHGALAQVDSGDIQDAIARCSCIWASLPGSPYGQPTHPLNTLLAEWGKLAA